MKTINFTKFPLYTRKGEEAGTIDIACSFFDLIFDTGVRKDVKKIQGFDEDQDIELTDENIEFFQRHLDRLDQGRYSICFEKYVEQLNK